MSGHPFDPAFEALPRELPIFPLTGALLLPRGQMPLNIFEPRYVDLFADALGAGRMIGMVQPTDPGETGLSVPDGTALYPIGCAGRIASFQETDDGRFLITLRGLCRFRIVEELAMRRGYRRMVVDFSRYAADLDDTGGFAVDRERLLAALREYFSVLGIEADWQAIDKAPDERLVTTLAMVCPFAPSEKQALLESPDMTERAKLMIGLVEMALREREHSDTPTVN